MCASRFLRRDRGRRHRFAANGCAITIKRIAARNGVMETVEGPGWSTGDKIANKGVNVTQRRQLRAPGFGYARHATRQRAFSRTSASSIKRKFTINTPSLATAEFTLPLSAYDNRASSLARILSSYRATPSSNFYTYRRK